MKRLTLLVVVAAGATAVTPSRGDNRSATTAVVDALSGVDFLPDHDRLTVIIDGDVNTLVSVAETVEDPGVRLRAYRSLGLFDSDVSRAGLNVAIARYAGAREGTNLLYLMAAIEALGEIGGAGAVPVLAPFLNVDSRDVRASTARALGQTHASAACAPLHTRLSQPETVPAVRNAIDQALSTLGAACTAI